MARFRNIVITWNNPPNNWKERILEWTKVKYFVGQAERCPTTDTPHIQGYIELHDKIRHTTIKSLFPEIHFENRRGTHQQAVDYCKKTESRIDGPWEWGIPNKGGERTDIKTACEAIKEGRSMKDISNDMPDVFVRHYKGLNQYKMLNTPKRNWQMNVFIYWGDTGTGKSRKASEEHPDAYWLPQGKWFDGYNGEETVIIDEFYGWLPWSFILRLTDRYPMSVETKGGSVEFVSKTIIFTSNQDPTTWYSNEKIHVRWETFARRITKIEHFVSPPMIDPIMCPVDCLCQFCKVDRKCKTFEIKNRSFIL